MKTILRLTICLITLGCVLPSQAQEAKLRVAVFDLYAGMNMSAEEIRGAANIFKAELLSSNSFIIIDHKLNSKISIEYNSNDLFNNAERIQEIGRLVDVDAIIIGTINQSRDGAPQCRKYHIDVQLVDAKTGTIISATGTDSQGAFLDRGIYTSIVQQLVKGYMSYFAIVDSEPFVLFDYLYVYPVDIGDYINEPTNVISAINKQSKYGFSDWRLPNMEEWSLLKANLHTIRAYSNYQYAHKGCWSDQPFTVRLVRTKVLVQEEDNNSGVVFARTDSHDYGVIPILKGPAKHDFIIQNQTKSAVSVTSESKSNPSISVKYDKKRIEPGETIVVTVIYNPNGRQGVKFDSDVHLNLSNGQTIKLNVKGHVN